MGFRKVDEIRGIDAWKCDRCGKVYLTAHEAEDCCAVIMPQSTDVYARIAELEAENRRLINAIKEIADCDSFFARMAIKNAVLRREG